MGGKGGGRIRKRELQAHGEGGEAGEGCRSRTGSGAWAVRHLGEHVVVRARSKDQGDGPLFVVFFIFVVAEFFVEGLLEGTD